MFPRILFFVVAVFHAAVAASAQDALYSAEFQIYRVEDQLIHVYNSDVVVPNAAIESKLDTPVSVAFEQMHVTHILDHIERVYDVAIEMDDGLVAPPNQDPAGFVTDGIVAYINLKDVTLRQGLSALLGPLGLGFAVENDRIRIDEASRISPLWRSLRSWYPPSEQWAVVESGSLRIGNTLIPLDSDALPALTQHSELELLGRPVVTVRSGQQGHINIDGAVQYLVQDPEDQRRFELRNTEEFAGLSVKFVFDSIDEYTVECDLDLNYSYVREREILAGTTIRAGTPNIQHSSAQAKHRVPIGQPIAMLRGTADSADDSLLILMRVEELPKAGSMGLAEFTVESRFIQVHGEPDWQFWTRPFGRAYEFSEGAGRVFGPVAIAGDLVQAELGAQVGFPDSRAEDLWLVSAPRVTYFIDPEKLDPESLFKLLITPTVVPEFEWPDSITPHTDLNERYKDADGNVFEAVNPIYDSLAAIPRKLEDDFLRGKATIIHANYRIDNDGNYEVPPAGQGDGIFLTIGAKSTDSPGVYRLTPSVTLRKKAMLKTRTSWKESANVVQTQFECDYEVTDGQSSAFLMPVEGGNWLLMTTTFQLVKPD